ncbi:hypothetical protein E2C01_101825 [Portunus trituberculatus]|uniref:Uncharacterized protein n=1 Tax=Portunus trituberculatus TaxID=210409 RepID=A0A5B7KGW3_PORTR|nr:hypothetical protein [Portunus trituberculatus]
MMDLRRYDGSGEKGDSLHDQGLVPSSSSHSTRSPRHRNQVRRGHTEERRDSYTRHTGMPTVKAKRGKPLANTLFSRLPEGAESHASLGKIIPLKNTPSLVAVSRRGGRREAPTSSTVIGVM